MEPMDYVYDLSTDAGLVLREIVPEMHTCGPNRPYRERANDDATGWTIWATSVLFARYIRTHRDAFAGQDILELGAGCGLVGLAAACGTAARSVCLSDYPAETVSNLLYNVGRNCVRRPDCADASGEDGGVRVRCAGRSLSLRDTFTSATGAAVSLAQFDWDEPSTWPRAVGADAGGAGGDDASAAAPDSPSGLARYDVIIAVDCFYRRSYARKVAVVARALLRPGGRFIVATPCAREGLQLLEDLMRASGFVATESTFPVEWRESPLRGPRAGWGASSAAGREAAGRGGASVDGVVAQPAAGLAAAEEGLEGREAAIAALGTGGLRPAHRSTWRGEDSEEGDLSVPLILDTAVEEGAPVEATLRLVGETHARGMFPELFMSSYAIVHIEFTRVSEAPADSAE